MSGSEGAGGQQWPPATRDHFSASLRALHLRERHSEDAEAVGSADRLANGCRDLPSAIQSGFQPTYEPTGFQPVVVQSFIEF